MRRQKLTNTIGILISILIGLTSFYAQTQNPETGITIFLALLGIILLYFLASYPLSIAKEKINQININSENIKKIKEDLNSIKDKIKIRKEIEDLKARILKLEK